MQTQDHQDHGAELKESEIATASIGPKDDRESSVQSEDRAESVQSESENLANELVVAARLESALRALFPCEVVKAENGVFTVDVEAPLLWESRLEEDFNRIAKDVPGVTRVLVHIVSSSVHGLG